MPTTAPSPDPPTSVHTLESPVEPETPLLLASELSPPLPQHFRNRHLPHHSERLALYDALARTGATPQLLARFLRCGYGAWILREKTDPTHYRIALDTCRHRLCPACAREKAHRIASNLAKRIDPTNTRFVTLTLRSDNEPLPTLLDRLRAAYRRLRTRRLWRDRVKGAVAFLEVKRMPDTARWHVHLHILAIGLYIPQPDLSREWLASTGDSHVVDIRLVRHVARAVRYVAKYAGKALDTRTLGNPATLADAVAALRNQKLIITTGICRHLKLTGPPEDSPEWERLAHVNGYLCHLHDDHDNAALILEAWHAFSNGLGRADFHIKPDLSPPPAHDTS